MRTMGYAPTAGVPVTANFSPTRQSSFHADTYEKATHPQFASYRRDKVRKFVGGIVMITGLAISSLASASGTDSFHQQHQNGRIVRTAQALSKVETQSAAEVRLSIFAQQLDSLLHETDPQIKTSAEKAIVQTAIEKHLITLTDLEKLQVEAAKVDSPKSAKEFTKKVLEKYVYPKIQNPQQSEQLNQVVKKFFDKWQSDKNNLPISILAFGVGLTVLGGGGLTRPPKD